MTSIEAAPAARVAERAAAAERRTPGDLLPVRVFIGALIALLAGYMFMGRGFAHIGVGPIFLGEVVLAIGLVATAYAVVRLGLRPFRSIVVGLLVLFMVVGLVRTIPYIGVYGTDALRDAVLWGYAFFALFIYLLADRAWLSGALRVYGLIVAIFALWLPIAFNIFLELGRDISNQTPGAIIPLVYFKAGDMTVHSVGAVAFLVLLTTAWAGLRTLAWRYVIAQPLIWTMFINGTISRGALLGAASGLGLVLLATRRLRNWLPVALAAIILTIALTVGPLIGPAVASLFPATAGPEPAPGETTPPPWWAGNRPTTIGGFVENFGSTFTDSGDVNQVGTKRFRLEWWGKIVDYTVFGPYFLTGKGFGVNLADDDGFQPTQDGSLRAPHNSSMTVLARMGVPGFVLWVALQGVWALGLLWAFVRNRRAGDAWLSAVSAWIFIYWFATMVVTSFDPYIEGPQGGIWFWTLFGLGLVAMRLAPQPGTTATVPLLGEKGWRESLASFRARGGQADEPAEVEPVEPQPGQALPRAT
ncbi:MAG TPA: O-antigen ligase family protein [Candidatus Eisenbacteria bacterium]|nr:O-antigen ligase family protein [Candidatus Eisenbacteria bacterium]